MFTLTVLQIICWALIGTTLCILALTMGLDLGIGTLLPFVGKTDIERRVAINVVGPTWDGNQVWFIFGGGAVFACWPMVYAASFSGLYIALLLLLWSLFLRPVGFEYRNKLANPHWRRFWDWGIFTGSFVPALIFGVAFGNLLTGMPFHYDDSLRNYYTGNFFGLLNPMGLLAGLVSVSMLVLHGSVFLQLRCTGIVQERARRATRIAGLAFIVFFALAGLWVAKGVDGFVLSHAVSNPLAAPFASDVVREKGAWLANYSTYHWMLAAPIMAFIGAFMAIIMIKRCQIAAILGSFLTVVGTVTTAGFSLFPFIMPSFTHPAESLTVWNATSNYYSLATFVIAVCIFLPIVFAYTFFVYKKIWRRINEETVREDEHVMY